MEQHRHGGNLQQLARASGKPPQEILDFSANINPLGPPEWLRSVISSHVSELVHYPDPDASLLIDAVAAHYGIPADEILVGNGSTEILYLLPRALPKARAVIPVPAYADYERAAELSGLSVEKVFLKEHQGFRLDVAQLESKLNGDELVFLGQPNNPTGLPCDVEALRDLAGKHPNTIFIVDEAFADFVEDLDRLACNRPANVIVLCSLTKFYAIPGLRLGCAMADRDTAAKVRRAMPPWTVNTLAQAVGVAALQDADYATQTRTLLRNLRERLTAELLAIPGLTVYPGAANFSAGAPGSHRISTPRLWPGDCWPGDSRSVSAITSTAWTRVSSGWQCAPTRKTCGSARPSGKRSVFPCDGLRQHVKPRRSCSRGPVPTPARAS